jgi:hypothetical protein
VTRITIGLDDALAARLAEWATRAGLTPEQLAAQLLADDLAEPSNEEGPSAPKAFSFFAAGSSASLRGRAVDELLAEGFGQ